MKEIVMYIFAAYKFNSAYYEKVDLERAIREAVTNAEAELKREFKDLRLQLIEQKEISSGEYVGEFVKGNLDKATITIFELSDREPNVTFELGYSTGIAGSRFTKREGHDILIQSDNVSHRDTISDLLGKFIVSYKYDTIKRQKGEYSKIRKKIESELKRKIINLLEDERFLKRLIWRMYGEKVYVICPYIPPKDQMKYGIRSALSEYGDFNAVYEVCTFLNGILHCDVEYFHSKEESAIKKVLSKNHVVIVGGPMWNDCIEKFMKDYDLPYQHDWSREEDVEDYIYCRIDNREFRSKISRKGDKEFITKDYGIFAVLPNRYNDDKTLIIISGINTVGGLGAVRAFTEGETSHDNCKMVVKTVGLSDYFTTIIESDIPWGEFPYPRKIKEGEVIPYKDE